MESIVEEFNHLTKRFLEADSRESGAAPEESFALLPGTSSVMVSAPHSVSQWRNGVVKVAENSTGALAILAHERLGCPVIFKTANARDDANYDAKSPYRDALAAYVESHDVKLLLDLHQLRCERPMEVCVGTGHGKNVEANPAMIPVVVDAFTVCGVGDVTVDDPFSARGENTIACSTSRRCGIPCFQIEINSRLMLPECDDFNPDAVFAALERIVRTFENAPCLETGGDVEGAAAKRTHERSTR